jgi:hypothetical protein
MIIVITNAKEQRDGKIKTIVWHGIDIDTGRNIPLPSDEPQAIGAVFSHQFGEYILQMRV